MPLTTCSISTEAHDKLETLHDLTGASKRRIMDTLIEREHAEVQAGKQPRYGKRETQTTGDNDET